ncbi:MAG: DNA polymerase III subunit beta [Planctomycetes bacterium]|nr:DNA polymerase III subunit beta [Planctomycetota bacterium]
MKVACDCNALTRAVQVASSVVAPRSPKPALGCIKMEAHEGRVTLLATDLEVGIRILLDKMDVTESGAGLVPADRFHAILRELDVDTISISSTEQETTIEAPGAHFSVLGDDPADFPQVPEFPESGAFEIAADELLALVERTLFATAKENTRYALNGVLWEVEGKNVTLVSTDGRRLSLARGKCKDGPAEKVSAIVPSKAMLLIQRCMADVSDASQPARVVLGEKEILVESPPVDGSRRVAYSRLVDGHFPKYDDVIPKDFDKKATLGAEAFLSAVRKAALLTNEESRGVTLKFSAGELVLTSRTPEMGEAEIRMPAVYEGDPLEIGFNPNYLMDAAKVVDAPELVFSFKSSSKPGMLTEGKTFIHVIMPVSIV